MMPREAAGEEVLVVRLARQSQQRACTLASTSDRGAWSEQKVAAAALEPEQRGRRQVRLRRHPAAQRADGAAHLLRTHVRGRAVEPDDLQPARTCTCACSTCRIHSITSHPERRKANARHVLSGRGEGGGGCLPGTSWTLVQLARCGMPRSCPSHAAFWGRERRTLKHPQRRTGRMA